MTVLENLVWTVSEGGTEWARFVATHRTTTSTQTCTDWDRRGASHYKDGVFTKK